MSKRIAYGTRVKIANITDPEDIDLNGMTGTLTGKNKFRNRSVGHSFGDIGVYVEGTNGSKFPVNVKHGEYEVI